MKEGNKIQGDGGLSQLDRYLRALSDKHQRYLLYYLDENGTSNTEELARYIAARELEHPPSTISKEDYESIEIKLHHQSLPRLRDYGLVDYDERSEEVRFAKPSQLFTILLRVCQLLENEP